MKRDINNENEGSSKQDESPVPSKRENIYAKSEKPADYTIEFDGWTVDFFKIPLSFKKRHKLNILALSNPGKPIGSILMNSINVFRMAVELINMQTGENYSFERILAQAGEDNLSNYGQKLIAAIARHIEENEGEFDEGNYMSYEKGYIDKKWIHHEPSEAELNKIIETNRANNPNAEIKKRKKRLTNSEKGKLELLKKIMSMKPNYEEELKAAARKDQKLKSRIKRKNEKDSNK